MDMRIPGVVASFALAWLFAGHAAAQPAAPQDSDNLDEVVVTAQKLIDPKILDHVIIPRFIQAHTAPTETIDQVSRWQSAVCPLTTGLQPAYNEIVSRRVMLVARSVGAPTRGDVGKCHVNIEIVFTTSPQELVDHIAKSYPILLGSSRAANDARVHRAVQAWYLTGTRSKNGYQPPHPTMVTSFQGDPNAESVMGGGASTDPPDGAGAGHLMPSGIADSHLEKGLVSEFQRVFVVVDASRVTSYPLTAISDYIAMIALTRLSSLDACSELPSIVDLLSSGCHSRAAPDVMTAADTAFLKALYSSDLERNLNIERIDMHDRMLSSLEIPAR